MARHEVRIGENVYYIMRFEPFTALEILGDLQKQFVAPFLEMMNGRQDEPDEVKRELLMKAFRGLSEKMDGKTLRALAERLIDKESVSVSIGGDSAPRKLDRAAMTLAFNGVTDIIQLCWEIISHNYSEVIARLGNPTGPAAGFLRGGQSENSFLNSKPN